MMYIWNGYTVIGKHKDLTEGILKTLNEAQQKLEQSPSTVPNHDHTTTRLNTNLFRTKSSTNCNVRRISDLYIHVRLGGYKK